MTDETTTIEAGLKSGVSADVSATENVQAGHQAVNQHFHPLSASKAAAENGIDKPRPLPCNAAEWHSGLRKEKSRRAVSANTIARSRS